MNAFQIFMKLINSLRKYLSLYTLHGLEKCNVSQTLAWAYQLKGFTKLIKAKRSM